MPSCSWRTRSGWSGEEYGYGWWIRDSGGHRVFYAWGYGGQFIYVVPTLDLVVVTTSDSEATTRDGGHLGAILGQAIGKDTKGTVIGAAAGAAAGTAAAKITEKWEGCLPSGSALRFVLTERVELTGA